MASDSAATIATLAAGVVIDGDRIVLNGVGDQACEELYISREMDTNQYNPVFNCCKTNREDYSPAVEAVLMALKQIVPHATRIGSDGDWGYEWVHGPGCMRSHRATNQEQCQNNDPDHAGLGGRSLYTMAFPGSPEPIYTFGSPLIGTDYENQTIYMPRSLECSRRGGSYDGLPFGVTMRWLYEQAEKKTEPVCWVCGEFTKTRVETTGSDYGPIEMNAPMCDYCFSDRLLGGKLLGYGFAEPPYRLVNTNQPRLI